MFLTSWLTPLFTQLSSPSVTLGPGVLTVWAQLLKNVSDLIACSRELLVLLGDGTSGDVLAAAVLSMRAALGAYPRFSRGFVAYAAVFDDLEFHDTLGHIADKVGGGPGPGARVHQ